MIGILRIFFPANPAGNFMMLAVMVVVISVVISVVSIRPIQ